MAKKQDNIEPRDEAHAQAIRFGQMIRQRREAFKLRQDDLVFSTGLGRRFIIELEAGKSSCQLGKALIVANALGLRLFDVRTSASQLGPIPERFRTTHAEWRTPIPMFSIGGNIHVARGAIRGNFLLIPKS